MARNNKCLCRVPLSEAAVPSMTNGSTHAWLAAEKQAERRRNIFKDTYDNAKAQGKGNPAAHALATDAVLQADGQKSRLLGGNIR